MTQEQLCLGNSSWGDQAWDQFGFSVAENGIAENSGQFGHEVAVTFFGPDRFKYQFLRLIFGDWNFVGAPPDPEGPVNCWQRLPEMCPFLPDASTNVVGDGCLWPSGYSIDPVCGNPTGFLDGTSGNCPRMSGAECVNITVNYRFLERELDPMIGYSPTATNCACSELVPAVEIPAIPDGTFIEWRTSRDFSVVQTPASQWRSVCDNAALSSSIGFPVNVLTTTYDVIWSNVPAVNERYLQCLSGSVNLANFLGFPQDSVLFIYRDAIRKARFNCRIVYDVRMQFIAKTEQCIAATGEEGSLCSAVHCGQLGLWNRAWFPQACSICSSEPAEAGEECDEIEYTNWHLVGANTCKDDGTCYDRLAFPRADFSDLFACAMNCCAECNPVIQTAVVPFVPPIDPP